MSQLSKRARSVLYAVVTEYTTTGEPVGSRTLARKHGFDLSPATIRNVLSDLEEAGYLTQPHTSAGRVPTEAAFRLFIDTLIRTWQLSPNEAARVAEHFDEIVPGTDVLRSTGQLLSTLTGAVGVVARSAIGSRALIRLRFIPTRPGELLSVMVFSDGAVENRYITADTAIGDGELQRIHNLLEELVEGRTVEDVRAELARRATQVRDELAQLLDTSQSLVLAALATSGRQTEVIIEGRANALDLPELADTDVVRDLFHTLEERERLVALLDRTIASERVQVFLGGETNELGGSPLSVVAAPFREGGRPAGSVGIIGPTRMDYPAVVPLVGATADAMSAVLSRSERDESTEAGEGDGSSGDGRDPI